MKRRNDAKRSYSKFVLRKRQTADSGSAFSYKQGKSLLHRCPAWIKILVLPAVSIAVFELPPVCAATLLLVQTILAFCLHFTLREQLSDLRAVLYYAAMLLFVKGVAFVAGLWASGNVGAEVSQIGVSAANAAEVSAAATNSSVGAVGGSAVEVAAEASATNSSLLDTAFMLLRLLCVMQTASIVFKTSTSLQLREGLGAIELAVRRVLHFRPVTPIADVISLFVNFIPQVSKNWRQVKRAWKARGGKNSIRMYLVLLPVLFSVGMKQAYTTSRAITVRNSRI